ncbi:MAG: RdgB/HAM1 family non-canonical purine NTP pyrophosphatase, partial [Chloroflexota bacterium]|nr:RdgB/HAM1 family non-canonical purine NTP pyrophosphatase [Chloroflexota bacterium]
LVSLSDVGIDVDVDETGVTYAENATLKAVAYAKLSGLPTLADDSGLEVDGLDGEPGVRSARYAGEDANDDDRIAFLLQKLNNIPREKWTARFRCVIALTRPDASVELYEGRCEGVITDRPRGASGFGYDPLFYIPDMDRTMAELSFDEKNRVSHRGRASQSVIAALRGRDWKL